MSTDIIANRYKIVREIARSNDVVYEAIDTTMGRRLAVKELSLPPNLTGQAKRERIERFNREARAAGKLQHPNIVTVYNFGEHDGRHFIAMEYLEGGTLRDRMQQKGALPLQEALEIVGQVLDALNHAHAHRVVHRDVKPDNIHILPGGQVKLTDFGIARLTEEASLTGEGQVFGTPSYMSPEQIEGRFIDHRSDLFSLAVLLYEMVAGRKPFTGDSVVSITYSIMHNDPTPLVGIPYGVEQAIFRALSKDPGRRFNSAEEMRLALKNADAVPSLFLSPQSSGMGGFGASPSYGSPSYGQPGGFGAPPSAYPQGNFGVGMGVPSLPHPGYPQGQTGYPGAHGSTVFAPPPQAAPPATAGGPFVNWGATGQPAPPVYAPAGFPRRPAGPLLSDGAKTFLAVLFGTVVLASVVVGLVILFLRAFDQNQQRAASDAVYRTFNEAKKLYDSDNLEQAAQKFEEAWKSAPNSKAGNDSRISLAVTLNRLGKRAYERNDLKGAESYWNKALDVSSDYDDARRNLATLYDRIGDKQRAMEQWQLSGNADRVSGPNPAAPGASSNIQSRQEAARKDMSIAQDAFARGDTDTAREYWQKVIGEDPGGPFAPQAQQYLDRTASGPNF